MYLMNLQVGLVKDITNYTPTNCQKRRKMVWNKVQIQLNVIVSSFQIALTLEIITAQLLDTSWSIPNHHLEETNFWKRLATTRELRKTITRLTNHLAGLSHSWTVWQKV